MKYNPRHMIPLREGKHLLQIGGGGGRIVFSQILFYISLTDSQVLIFRLYRLRGLHHNE